MVSLVHTGMQEVRASHAHDAISSSSDKAACTQSLAEIKKPAKWVLFGAAAIVQILCFGIIAVYIKVTIMQIINYTRGCCCMASQSICLQDVSKRNVNKQISFAFAECFASHPSWMSESDCVALAS